MSQKSKETRRNFVKSAVATASVGASVGLAGCTGSDSGSSSNGVHTFDIAYLPGAVLNGNLTKSFTIDHIRENVLPNPLGEAYEIDGIEVGGTNEIVSSMMAGEADGGVVPPGPLSAAIDTGRLSVDEVSIIWPESIYGPDAGHSDNYASAEGSGITDWEDIPGSTFAVNTFGSGSDISARLGMRENGIDPEEDVDMVQIGFGDMVAALEEERIDIGTFLQPFYEQAREAVGELNYLYDFATPFGNTMTFFMIMKNEVIEDNPEAVTQMAENVWETAQFSRNEEAYDEDIVAREIAEAGGISTDTARELQYGVTDEDYPSPEGRAIGFAAPYKGWRMEAEFVNPAVEGLSEAGVIDEMIDYSPMITNEFIPDEADQPPEPLR